MTKFVNLKDEDNIRELIMSLTGITGKGLEQLVKDVKESDPNQPYHSFDIEDYLFNDQNEDNVPMAAPMAYPKANLDALMKRNDVLETDLPYPKLYTFFEVITSFKEDEIAVGKHSNIEIHQISDGKRMDYCDSNSNSIELSHDLITDVYYKKNSPKMASPREAAAAFEKGKTINVDYNGQTLRYSKDSNLDQFLIPLEAINEGVFYIID